MIKVVGMGVKDGDVSIRGAVAIDDAEVIIVKTALTETYGFFKEYQHLTCDDIYEQAANFDALDENIANFVLSYKDKKTVFCVDGSGVDDRSVILIKQLVNIEIICGVSRETFAIKESPTTQHISMSAYDYTDNPNFNYDGEQSLIIKDIDNELVATEVKELLSKLIGDESAITFVKGDFATDIDVYELDRQSGYDYSTQIMIKPQNILTKSRYSYMDLLNIMYLLRGDDGCAWDKAQDHKSIRANLIEESYELVDAIDNGDIDNIIEEIGDILLQAAFHTVIGDDEGEFEAHEVLDGICKKLISRHTHIFGSDKASNPDEALTVWEKAKLKEKGYARTSSKMDLLPRALPALLRGKKAQKIAAKWGLEFTKIDEAEHRVIEELKKFIKAEDKETVGGELLFDVVNLLRFAGIDGEVALNRATENFINVFKRIEKNLGDKTAINIPSQELINLWNEAKK